MDGAQAVGIPFSKANHCECRLGQHSFQLQTAVYREEGVYVGHTSLQARAEAVALSYVGFAGMCGSCGHFLPCALPTFVGVVMLVPPLTTNSY